MSDINKLVAAILTAGRLPTWKYGDNARPMDDWLAEYNAWVGALDKQDEAREAENSQRFVDSLKNL